MLNSEILVIAGMYPTPPLNTGRRGKRQDFQRGLLTGCVYIIIVSTENKQLSTTTRLLISDMWVYVCKHIMHVMYIGTYKVMVRILSKTYWLDE